MPLRYQNMLRGENKKRGLKRDTEVAFVSVFISKRRDSL